MLRFHEDIKGEVWELNPYPGDPNLVLTCGGGVHKNKPLTNLWRMPEPPDMDFVEEQDTSTTQHLMQNESSPLENVKEISLNSSSSTSTSSSNLFCSTVWKNHEDQALSLLTLRCNNDNNKFRYGLSQWDLEYNSTEPVCNISIPCSSFPSPGSPVSFYGSVPNPKLALDPHNPNLVAFNHGTCVSIADLRSNSFTPVHQLSSQKNQRRRRQHRYNIMDLDYNPNKPHVIATGGQDGLLKFWDLRASSSSTGSSYNNIHSSSSSSYPGERPIKIAKGGHSHWISRVQFNPFHDQLILSGGTDSAVNLWRISSISSSPLLELDSTCEKKKKKKNKTNDPAFDDDNNSQVSNNNDEEEDNMEFLRNNSSSIGNEYNYDDDDYSLNNEGRQDEDDEDESNSNSSNDNDSTSVSSSSVNTGPDIRVSKVKHQESVYDVAWSSCDAWVWVSLGLDGGVILSHVPSKEKYKILL
eukprot:CAMPEP_0178972410 /NCGR_PEP_ID=MMETSP0789-20121207/20997_1 /TAXON_ID=3005 /ORGANISM="Rhizosolenia setigera, Strain CCMP 1694" /LENGTH=467 /DNA_ID=CAMNT_0020659853 /DNA_START=179 /DNA_END=1582 /DNA_ORIENTATION=+